MSVYLTLEEAHAKHTICLGESPKMFLMHPATKELLKKELTLPFIGRKLAASPQESFMGVPLLTSPDCPKDCIYVGMRADLIRHTFSLDWPPQLAAYHEYLDRGEVPPPHTCRYYEFHGKRCGKDHPGYRHRRCPGPAECGEAELKGVPII